MGQGGGAQFQERQNPGGSLSPGSGGAAFTHVPFRGYD